MGITIDESIDRFSQNAEYERTHGNLQGCLEFRQLVEWLKDYKRLKKQESNTNIRECGSCKYSKDGHRAGTEECHECMWESKQEPTVKAIPLEKLEHIKNRIIESSIIDDDEKYVDNGNLIIEVKTVLQIIDNAIKEKNE